MLAALCLALVFAIVLTSYVTLTYTSLKTSTRNLMNLHCIELAEAGIEQALYSQNNNDWTTQPWSVTSSPTPIATLAVVITPTSIGAPSLENGETWEFKVQVTNYGTSSPQFQSWGIVALPDGTSVTRELTTPTPAANAITPAPAPVFVNAIAATTGSVNLGSSTTVDSYTSGPTYVPPGVVFSAVVLSGSPAIHGVILGSGTVVEGYAVGTNSNSFSYLPGSSRVIGPSDSSSVYVNLARLIVNPQPFQPFQPPLTEIIPGGGTSIPITLTGAQTLSLGSPTALSPVVYYVNGMSLAGSSVLSIAGPVILVVTGGLVVSGTSQILIEDTAILDGGPHVSLEIHLPSGSGNSMNLGGGGIYNSTGDSRRLIIMGSTNTLPQSLGDPAINPLFAGTVYFPNAPLTVVGSSVMYGSLVAQSVTFSGSSSTFHYDTALRTVMAPPNFGYPSFSSFNQYYNPLIPPVALGALTEAVPASIPTF